MTIINENKNFSKLSKARYAAYNAISELSKNQAYARDILNDVLEAHVLSSSDKAFASKLTLGVTQTMGTLDDVLFRCVDSPDDIKPNVLNALRISTYEIVYLEKESHAAVDQGVELVKHIEPRAKGFANLVLRRVVKQKKDFPYGNPDTNIDAFARVYSVPKWECNLICESLGEKYGRYLIASCNGQPPCYIFVNSIKSNVEEMMTLLDDNDAKPVQVKGLCGLKLNSCIRVEKPIALRSHDLKSAYQQGKFLITDIAAQAIVQSAFLSANHPGGMLEICAGKGNKTIMFQSLANQAGERQMDLFTVDNSAHKISIAQARVEKYGVNVTSSICSDASNIDIFTKDMNDEFNGFLPSFDLVFVDSPCSGLGTLRRHPELKWRLKPEDVSQMANQGLQILKNASDYVSSNGVLAYSTCTVTNIENEFVCQKFLSTEEGKRFRLLKYQVEDNAYDYFRIQTFSGLNDVHFCAVFQKIAD